MMTKLEAEVLAELEKIALPPLAASLMDEKKLRNLPPNATLDFDQKVILMMITSSVIRPRGYDLFRKASANLDEYKRLHPFSM